jgi:membrane protein YqaA with SNARE-associated domain
MQEWISPENGLAGVFAASFLASTIVPLSSEAVLFGYLKLYPDQVPMALALATVGNTLGGLTSYAIGRMLPARSASPPAGCA